MMLSISVYESISIRDVLLNAIQRLVRYLWELMSETHTEEGQDIPTDPDKQSEDSTGPPTISIAIIEDVKTGEAFG